jgi:carbamate kinase
MQRTGKRLVIALGGNALGKTLPEQMAAVKLTAKAIADLVEDGHEIILSHGNGPQVGMLQTAMAEYANTHREPPAPLSVCVAMSQGYIGYDLQNALREELIDRGIHKAVSTVLTQVRVDPDDPAFLRPTKPIGHFMTREEAEAKVREKDWTIAEDAGRGYRRLVASPRPVEIVEIETVRALLTAGQIVVAAGGGGIPVVAHGHHLSGVGAVIDKDLASALMADTLDADALMILTAVERVAIRFGKPDQKWLSDLPWREALAYMEAGEFAEGSMKPKVQAAVEFVRGKEGRTALITELCRAREGVRGETGTLIH